MPHLRVVLVEPLHDGNVGAVARAMKNFGLEELVLVRPCAIGEEATKRAMHGIDILKNARTVFTDGEALDGVSYVAGTSGIDTRNDKHFARISMGPREFAEKVRGFNGTVALVFGREDFGLDKSMIRRCDFLVKIPANESYPIMNLSHAAAVLFYEIFAAGLEQWSPKKAEELETEKLNEYFANLLDAIDYPEHKREKTRVMFRRLVARAVPSTWEFHTLMGVLDGAVKIGDASKKDRAGKGPKSKRRTRRSG